jgi:hypothetical protein
VRVISGMLEFDVSHLSRAKVFGGTEVLRVRLGWGTNGPWKLEMVNSQVSESRPGAPEVIEE